jgi:hypothetical protein
MGRPFLRRDAATAERERLQVLFATMSIGSIDGLRECLEEMAEKDDWEECLEIGHTCAELLQPEGLGEPGDL